jgi:hypothetical protein
MSGPWLSRQIQHTGVSSLLLLVAERSTPSAEPTA